MSPHRVAVRIQVILTKAALKLTGVSLHVLPARLLPGPGHYKCDLQQASHDVPQGAIGGVSWWVSPRSKERAWQQSPVHKRSSSYSSVVSRTSIGCPDHYYQSLSSLCIEKKNNILLIQSEILTNWFGIVDYQLVWLVQAFKAQPHGNTVKDLALLQGQ